MSRARGIARRAGARPLAARIVVVTEGASTEPTYLKVFSRSYGHQSLRLVPIGGVGDPRAVVERAIEESEKLKGDPLAGRDSVWAMFDRDAHARFDEAKDLARGNGIPLAVSNPCFELWAVFHYRDHDAPIDRHACQQMLRELCPGYRKKGGKVFDDWNAIENGYPNAVERAESSLARREAEGVAGENPSTTVHRLTEYVRCLVKCIDGKK